MRKRENAPDGAVKLMIFDMDGVLVDSEPLHERAHREQLEALGLAAYQDTFNIIGVSTEEFLRRAVERARQQGAAAAIPPPHVLVERHFARARALIMQNCQPPSAELVSTLEALRAAGVRCAVVSSSPRTLVDAVLTAKALRPYFHYTLCGDEVARMKPAPDLYLRALALAQVHASEALSVEDSASGLQAAEAAGVFCLCYAPYGKPPAQAEPTRTIGSFRDILAYI